MRSSKTQPYNRIEDMPQSTANPTAEQLVADAIRRVVMKLEERKPGKIVRTEDLAETLLTIADELDSPSV